MARPSSPHVSEVCCFLEDIPRALHPLVLSTYLVLIDLLCANLATGWVQGEVQFLRMC